MYIERLRFAIPGSHRHFRVVLVAQKVVNEASAGVAVAADCHPLVHAVGVARDDVVEFVGHAAALRHIRHRARSVQLRTTRKVEEKKICIRCVKVNRVEK